MQLAGIEAQHVVLLLEDYQFVQSTFLEMINSLLSSGEIKIRGQWPTIGPDVMAAANFNRH